MRSLSTNRFFNLSWFSYVDDDDDDASHNRHLIFKNKCRCKFNMFFVYDNKTELFDKSENYVTSSSSIYSCASIVNSSVCSLYVYGAVVCALSTVNTINFLRVVCWLVVFGVHINRLHNINSVNRQNDVAFSYRIV